MALTDTGQSQSVWATIRKLDRVVLAVVAVTAVIFLVDAGQGYDSVAFVADAVIRTGPFLILSVLVAAYAGASGGDNLIGRAFAGRTVQMIFLAALIGGLSPFCSCGVVPIIAALFAMGVPLAPIMAFWLASPVIDPAQFVLTAGLLGLPFAIAKTAAAVGLGLFGGFAVMWLSRFGLFDDALRDGVGNGGCGGAKVRSPKPVAWAFWREPERVAKFGKESWKTAFFLAKWLVLAFLLESLMLAYVPAETVTQWVGGEGLAPVALATLIGVPAYLNGYAALPLVSGLMEQGMSPGAGLSFLVAGGVTSLPAAMAVFALVRWPVFLSYLGMALAGSFMAGVAFQMLAPMA